MKRIGLLLGLLLMLAMGSAKAEERAPKVTCGPNKVKFYWTNVCVIGSDGYGYCGQRCWQIAQSLAQCLDGAPMPGDNVCERLRLKNQACARGENPDTPPAKTGSLHIPSVNALARSASPRGGVEARGPLSASPRGGAHRLRRRGASLQGGAARGA